jgi:hypothetical protein
LFRKIGEIGRDSCQLSVVGCHLSAAYSASGWQAVISLGLTVAYDQFDGALNITDNWQPATISPNFSYFSHLCKKLSRGKESTTAG